jgi:hypothetical protein
MINQEQMWREFRALPPSAQQQVLDFIAFMRTRYAQVSAQDTVPIGDLREEPFVGIWHDHVAMSDSSRWVRAIRAQEWE